MRENIQNNNTSKGKSFIFVQIKRHPKNYIVLYMIKFISFRIFAEFMSEIELCL